MTASTIAIHSENEFSNYVSSSKLTIVDFTATWCGPCKAIAPRFESLSTQYSNVNFLKVDVDEMKSIATAHNITAMPTFVFFKNGETLDKVVGADINKVEQLLSVFTADTSALTAEELKALGNKAFSANNHELAIKYFSDAIAKDPKNHVLFSNRSASYTSIKSYTKALSDAEEAIKISPSWAKGYSRKGAALHGLGNYKGAVEAYKKGLELEPANAAMKKSLQEAESLLNDSESKDADDGTLLLVQNMLISFIGLAKLFGGDVFSKIASNPKLSPYLAQPDFVQKIADIQRNPKNLSNYMQDPRIMNCMLGLMGLDATAMGKDEMEEQMNEDTPAASGSSSSAKPKEEPKPAKKEESKPVPMEVDEDLDDEAKQKKAKRAASDAAKDAGNALYKRREFVQALAKYDEAWGLDETNVTVLTNKSAALFEMGNYEECIKTCDDAVEKGREQRADFKLIAKALARMGTAYHKLNDLPNAIKYYQKSLSEHRTPDVLNKLRDVEKLQKLAEKEAYRNPALSDAARERGNELFKGHDYAGAVKEYTEAIKRNDADPRNFSNRAACYIKLMALPEADRDCDEAIKLDASFAKAYVRKASILVAKREWMKALDMCTEAKEKDVDGKLRSEIEGVMMKAYNGLNEVQSGGANREQVLENAMKNPEVQEILADPIMKSILQQMQDDPAAAKE
ncbi:Hsp90 cochaperone [Entophlyctis luteolus]|nr:Hsp90 cochaperone [Entophlyctis luteolus]